jgi:hypothetical protein
MCYNLTSAIEAELEHHRAGKRLKKLEPLFATVFKDFMQRARSRHDAGVGLVLTQGRRMSGLAQHMVRSLGDAKSSLGDAKSSLGDAKSSLGDAKSTLGDAKSSRGDAKSSLGDAKSSLGDAKSSLGDAKSSLGDAESSLGDA